MFRFLWISGPFSPSGRPVVQPKSQLSCFVFIAFVFEGKWNNLLLLWDEELTHHTFFSFNSHDTALSFVYFFSSLAEHFFGFLFFLALPPLFLNI
jgi:hypothetical protein